MVQLDLDNVYLKITNLDKDPEMKLWNELSFQVQVYGQQEIHYRHLYNRKTKKTYAGLMDYVVDFFKKEEIDYQLIDHRTKHESNADFSLVDYIDKENNIELKLRPYQQEIVDNCREREVIQAATGAGKALPLYTSILTPDGWKAMEDIHVGDTVYDEDGKETKVIGEFPQGKLEVWELEFDDGNTIECSKDHLWKFCIVNKKSREKSEWLEKTTEEMLKLLKDNELFIPVVKPIEMSKKNLPYHPYLAGQIFAEKELKLGKYANRFYEMTKDFSQEELDKLYAFDDFKQYVWSSIADRQEFLKGLTEIIDGKSVAERWDCDFETIMEFKFSKAEKTEFVYRIFCSLGFSPVWDKDDLSFSVGFMDDDFNVEYNNNEQMLYYHIENIYSINHKTEMKCIAVDSPKKTYVCQNYIVTHNTLMMAAIIAKFNVKPVFVFADKIGLCMQLKQEIEKFLGVEVGLVGDGIEEYKDITVVSLQSAKEEQIQKAKMILFDECLPPKAKVMLADGTYSEISRIVTRLKKGEQIRVMSYNVDTKQFEPKSVINYGRMQKKDRKMVRINIRQADGTLKTVTCTDNHKIWVESLKQYIPAKDLVSGQKVVSVQRKYKCEECEKVFDSHLVLGAHKSSAHGELNKKKKFKCEVCGEELFCSLPTYKAHVKSHDVEYRQLRGKHISIAKKIFYADEERSKFAREYMSEYMKQNNPMDRQDVIEKMIRSRKEYFDNMTDEEYSNFVRNFINASPTSFKEPTHPERVIMSLNIPNLEYNGSVEDSKTYRFKKDNSLKNSATPDFIYYDPITGVEKFVECFGEHWHKKGEDIALEMAYKNNGYEALVLWEYEPLEKQIEKLEKFLGVTIR